MATVMSEPFPLLNTASDQLHNAGAVPRQRRRKSSALGGEIRAGDTGAPAMATSRASLRMTDSNVSRVLIYPFELRGPLTFCPCFPCQDRKTRLSVPFIYLGRQA